MPYAAMLFLAGIFFGPMFVWWVIQRDNRRRR